MKILIFAFLISFQVLAANKNFSRYQKVFKRLHSLKEATIPDPINYKPVNTKLLIASDKSSKILGYIREVKTNTGCNSACLPILFTLYYDHQKKYKKLESAEGLTKLNHEDFTPEDYFKLDTILLENPAVFQEVTHPFDMVDGITRATIKKFQPHVVKTAAYSSLRINTYNQHTLQELKKLK